MCSWGSPLQLETHWECGRVPFLVGVGALVGCLTGIVAERVMKLLKAKPADAKVDNQYIFIGSLQELKDINLLGRVAGKPRLCPQLPEGPGLISGLIWAPTPIISEGYPCLVSAPPAGSLYLAGGKEAEKVLNLIS